jgi:uncharacterized protein
MSQTKFEIVRTGETFFYDNSNNGLYMADGTPLSKPFVAPPEWDQLKDRFGATHRSKAPETIKISLGQGCNYSCGYCLQKDIGNPDERPANGLTPMLIKNIRRHLDLNELARFELWGGETLLYWRDMMPIMEEFDREGITWYIPTNGTPLMHKHIDFFMHLKGNVAMGISHDGPGHERLRGKEFLHKKVEIFQRIEAECGRKVQYSFNPVISRTNYDLFKINDFFVEYLDKNGLAHRQLSYELGRVYDKEMAENSTHHVIGGEDISKYRDIVTRYLDAHIDQYRELGETKDGRLLANSLFHTGMGVLEYARTLHSQKVPLLKTNCGVDDSKILTMDLMGNARTCQNVDESYNSGNLMYIKGIKIQRVNLNRDYHCGTCEVRRLCKSSCPLDLGQAVHYTNCAIEKTHYRAIQLAAFKLLFNSDVRMVCG